VVIPFHGTKHMERIYHQETEYLLRVGELWVLDCYPCLKTCKASRMNDIRKVGRYDDDGTVIKPIKNCRISCSPTNHTAKIISLCNIKRFTELFGNYGDEYVFY
jgi:hypothetical protein